MFFSKLIFIDTLETFISNSRGLGWITSQEAAKKYLDSFRSARSQVQAGRSTEAIGSLRTVLRNANSDSSSVLTSEAYALTRNNTEYLVDKLNAVQRQRVTVTTRMRALGGIEIQAGLDFVRIGGLTGMRLGEILDLRWPDYDASKKDVCRSGHMSGSAPTRASF